MLSKAESRVRYSEYLRIVANVIRARDVSNGLMDSGNLTDSPDLGPPPVSRLDEGDATETSPTKSEANAPLNRKLGSRVSLDADARKKRRESFHQVNAAQTNAADGNANDPARDPVATQPLKSSAKRKFNVRDGEGKHPIPRDSSTQRQRQVAEKATDTTRSQETDRKRPGQHVVTRRDEVGTFGGNRTNAGGHRKPLGPKSVNSNLSSPVKKVQDTIKQERVSSQEDLVKPTRARGSSKESAATMGSINFTTKDLNTVDNVELPPKTPAIEGLDLFSPSVSDPSERRPERGDTPPPPDLGADSTGSFGRGSRRSRGSVSYAEPNLRDKMRRPTKDLIDAVSTGERSRQAASNKRESEISSLEVDMAVLDIKSAAPLEVQPVWRTKPVQESRSQQERQRTETTSPLGKKATSPAAALPASVVTDRRRGSSSLSRRIDDGASMALGNGSGTSIAALSAASQRQQCKDNQLGGRGSVSDSTSHDPLEANIFDFTSSSPEKHDKAGKQGEQAKPMRVSRRHSTVAALGEHGKGSLRISRRKRESVVESTEAIDSPASEESNSQPRQAQDVMAPEIESGGSTSRGTSRRRSMMI